MIVTILTGCQAAGNETAAVPEAVESESGEITIVDGLGKTVTLKKNPQRVICLYTSYLDVWDLAGGSVVGRSEGSENVPESAKTVETVGIQNEPNVEKILSLEPDLIIMSSTINSQVSLIPMFEKSGISCLALDYVDFEDYLSMLKVFTDLTGNEEQYKTKGLEVKEKIDSIVAQVPKDKKPSVLLMFGTAKSVSVRLPDTTVGSMLQDLGTINIAYDENLKAEEMKIFSMEKIIEKNPDFIFVQTMGNAAEATERIKKDVEENPAWGYLTAVKEGRYIYLPKDLFLFKPNERYAEAYEQLARLLYPETLK
jgi:iron complex transport system substrate-binding protein